MKPAATDARPAPTDEWDVTLTVARNVSTRYLAIAVEAVLGVLILPFNVSHLGQSAYGLWMLTASITAYFSVLDLGYGGALVKYVAHYRARKDAQALNEILSTAFWVFATFGLITYFLAIGLAASLGSLFRITPDQVEVGRKVLLITSLNVAAGTAFGVYGSVINGFQRYDLNNIVGTISSAATAAVNVLVLSLGYDLVALVTATTLVRLLTYLVYRANAYRVFPALSIRPSLFRLARLRELTMFSVYMLIIDWANKVNYSVDALVVGMFLGTTAVAIWAVGQRVAELTQRLSNQLNEVLFPTIVDCDSAERVAHLQAIFVQGTRLSLATVVPLAGTLAMVAQPLVHAWVGPTFAGSAIVLQLLSIAVIVRVAGGTATTLLKAAGRHKLVAAASAVSAVCNPILSVAMVSRFGLPGVAVAAFVPLVIVSAFVVFPAACHRVGLSVVDGWTKAVWPALWPALIMVLFVTVTRSHVGDSLIAIAFEIGTAGVIYLGTFAFFGISAAERRFYLTRLGEITARFRLQPVSEGA